MTAVTKLLDEATPLPWDRAMFASPDGPGWDSDAALIVYAVNRLPDYEAVVDALERLVDAAAGISTSKAGWVSGKSTGGYELIAAQEAAIAALARLREAVPA